VRIYPPGIDHQTDTADEVWEAARQWVLANRKQVWKISGPYRRYMAADGEDLLQEAMIAVVELLNASRQKTIPQEFVGHFSVNFKYHCLKLACGIRTHPTLKGNQLPGPEPEDRSERYDFPDRDRIETALKKTPKTCRKICGWLLEQPFPINTKAISRHFMISQRHAQRVINTAVQRISRAGQ